MKNSELVALVVREASGESGKGGDAVAVINSARRNGAGIMASLKAWYKASNAKDGKVVSAKATSDWANEAMKVYWESNKGLTLAAISGAMDTHYLNKKADKANGGFTLHFEPIKAEKQTVTQRLAREVAERDQAIEALKAELAQIKAQIKA